METPVITEPSSAVPTPTATTFSLNFVSLPAIGEHLNGTNYVVWKTRLIPFLQANHLLLVVDGFEPSPLQLLQQQMSNDTTSSSAPPITINPTYSSWLVHNQMALARYWQHQPLRFHFRHLARAVRLLSNSTSISPPTTSTREVELSNGISLWAAEWAFAYPSVNSLLTDGWLKSLPWDPSLSVVPSSWS
ncbi:hypothetical protein Patl1_34813 [Pistacia atlantica]|uniref:Uncharacterized protein n=1 Tax=Pistacia atlantica TaxID=434234 RepID=A0ACC0ZVL5_9ROSI|nr:hypothetical protein Patl1_34813 [Pistacia atlantica]